MAGVALAVCVVGCGLPPNPRRPHLWTMSDLEALAAPEDPKATFATDDGVPGGLRVSDYVTHDGEGYHLTLRDTWTEAYRSAYVTAEVWTGFDDVWVQPVYMAITGFDDNGAPKPLADPDKAPTAWSPIFSVGPDSAFYSPFWRVFYFQVPETTSPDAYTSARQVIDSGLPLIEGPPHTMSLVPGDVALPMTVKDSSQQIGGPATVESGYLDGKNIKYLDFGKNNFTWDDALVVEETPLFMLLWRDTDGSVHPMNVPTVAGTGPLYANRAAKVVGNVPHYGAYWRLYTVIVPATARIFAPPTLFGTQSADYYPQEIIAQHYGQSVLDAGANDVGQWLGRVALNATPSADSSDPGCFDKYDYLDTSGASAEPCQWLDSQPALEKAVPSTSIQKTDILVTCPFVSYHDAPVTP